MKIQKFRITAQKKIEQKFCAVDFKNGEKNLNFEKNADKLLSKMQRKNLQKQLIFCCKIF